MSERRLPPVTQVGMTSLALTVGCGVYMASHPRHVTLGPAVAVLALAWILFAVNAVSLARAEGFARRKFRYVFGWALLAYALIAGMIEYVFLLGELNGSPLVVLTLALVLFALDVPTLIAFTTARYADPEAA